MSPSETREREYERSHPWITFAAVDLQRAPALLWMLLGEARSKIEHIEGAPILPGIAEELRSVYLIKGAVASSQIEGNTLTEEQVDALLKGILKLPPSQQYLQQEVENLIDALNEIRRELGDEGPKPLTSRMIREWNRQVLKHLESEPDVVPGEFREESAVVGPYRGAPAQDVKYLIDRLSQWLNDEFAPPSDDPDLRIVYAIVKAVVAHLYFEWIHPFADGNGRTGRLLEFQILLSSGVPFPAAHLLSNHYNLTRSDYYRRLAETSRERDVLPFLQYAVRGFVDGLREQITRIREQQLDLVWENYVHYKFRDRRTSTAHRQRTLVFALSQRGNDPTPRRDLLGLNREVAAAHAGRGPKTLTRDLNALVSLGLVRETPDGWIAQRDIVRAFLPGKVALTDE